MRVAALCDIHGNLPALEAVLADPRLGDADAIVVGGDVVAGPFPAETVDALEALGERVRFLRGNADRLVLEDTDDRSLWCRRQLGARAKFVAAWPQTLSLEIAGLGPVRFCHATPRSDEEIITRVTPDDEVADALEGTDETVVVCGHTHIQYDRRARWMAARLRRFGGLAVRGSFGSFLAASRSRRLARANRVRRPSSGRAH